MLTQLKPLIRLMTTNKKMIISKVCVGLSMFVINATCNGCRLEALNFGALNVVFNTWVFLGFFLLTKSGLNSKSHVATLVDC